MNAIDTAALTPSERNALRLKALLDGPTGKTVFMECLNRACPTVPAWGTKTLNALLESLRAKGLLTEALTCRPDLIHPLSVEAFAAPEGEAMVAAIRALAPPGNLRVWDTKAVEASIGRWLRLSVLLNDEVEFKRQADLRARHGRGAGEPIDALYAGIEVGVDWLASRTPGLRLAIVAAKYARFVRTGSSPPDFGAVIEYCRRDPEMRAPCYQIIADLDLLGGRLDALAELVAAPPKGVLDDLPACYGAAHALLTGDAVFAAARFSEALRLYRRTARKRKGGFPGHLGLLHCCALIAADETRQLAEIEDGLEGATHPIGHWGVIALRGLLGNDDGLARHAIERGMAALAATSTPPPFEIGLLAVAAFLVDPNMVKRHGGRLPALFRRFEDAAPLAAGMLAEVLERVAEKPAPYRAFLSRPSRIAFRFLGLVPVKDPWERALDGIEAMLAPADAAPSTPKAKRLVWRVDADTGDVEALEQSAQVRGWTAGRNVALKRLHQGDAKLDYMDEFDRRAARTIRRAALDGWNHYGQEIWEFQLEKTLPALVGHPRVFDRNDPSRLIELVEGRAELVLSSDRNGFQLTMSHPASRPGAFIDVETPNRWRVVVVDAKAIQAASFLGATGISIPAAARDRLAALARIPDSTLPLRIETPEIEDGAAVEGDPRPVVRLLPNGAGGLTVSLVVRPLGADGPHYLPGIGGRIMMAGATRLRRDLAAERDQAAALAAACPSLMGDGPDWVLDDAPQGLELLAELAALPQPPPMEWPEGGTLTLRGEASAKRFRAKVKGSDGWFTLGGSVAIDEDLVLDLKDLLSRLDQAQGRFVPLGDGGFVALDRHFRQQLERLRRVGDGLKLPAVATVAVRDLLDDAASLDGCAKWKAFVKRLDEAEGWSPRPPLGFEAELRDYQAEGFVWMSRLARWGAGALLADDMGLGKTVQAIAVMVGKAAEGPSLVVAPTSVCGNWEAELRRFAPGLTVRRLAEAGERAEILSALGPGCVLITSYGLLAREEAKLTAITWAMAVLDEAQAIKNADTRRARASLGLNAGFRLALTGTPVENDLDELWSVSRFVNPGLLGSREAFAKRFATPIERDGSAAAKAGLRALMRPFLLRRTKASVLSELPARTEQTLLVEMGDEERAFYEALRRRALERLEETAGERTRIHILAEITKLRRACCHPALATTDAGVPGAKLEAFRELVAELREGRHRALVFSQFVGHLDKIRAALDADGISYQYLDGATPSRERDKRVAAFQAGQCELFLISLKAGGFGLNLTAADYVVHLDPWWNPAVEDQASDRAHRIGQQ
ncbi:MAG: DEAD/DEAH box helicase, partial [Alphaproteobacteria bacterium]|nr:DEAD/DEAH box helicase [Alphaproteobacteria bacterium]